MATEIPQTYLDLFATKAFAALATMMAGGSPQVTPVWVDFDGKHIIVNSVRGRQKDENMKRNPLVSLAISDPKNPYRYLEIRGRVVEITKKGASEHIDKMARKYLDLDKYPNSQPGEVRVLYKIEPLHTTHMG